MTTLVIKTIIAHINAGFWCNYITGDVSFIYAIAGLFAAELTPKYPNFISERVYALSDATRWWYEYGKECLSIK